MLGYLIRLGDAYRRVLAVVLGIVGPRAAYRFTALLARLMYRSLDTVRLRTQAQVQAATAGTVRPEDLPRVAEASFIHRIWNLTDLLLVERLLHPGTYRRYGGALPEPFLGLLRTARDRREPVILLTAYYGPFDLLPAYLGYNGIHAAVVYRPHRNPRFDAWRKRIRGRSGCELIPIQQAMNRVPAVLEAGGMVALLADHHTEGRGVPATFLGLPTVAPRFVALLARQYRAVVAVAGIRRTRKPFHVEFAVTGLLKPEEWAESPDSEHWITTWYLGALEKLILADPAQYLWSYARWGERMAGQLADAEPKVNSPRWPQT